MRYDGVFVKYVCQMSNVLIVNRGSLEIPATGQRAISAIPTYLIRIKKNKTSFTKSSFVTLLNALYDTKVENSYLCKEIKKCFFFHMS
jgi:hypothetical protein